MTDQINRVLAERVMGWQLDQNGSYYCDPGKSHIPVIDKYHWNPMQKWSDAGLVIEKMMEKGLRLMFDSCSEESYATFYNDDGYILDMIHPAATKKTGPAAISMAAYEAINATSSTHEDQ